MDLYYTRYSNHIRSDKVPILILHGLLGSGKNWQGIAAQLAGRDSVFAIDLRNHGQSPHDMACDYETMAADLLTFCEALCALDLGRIQTRKEADAALATAIPDTAIRQFLLTNLRCAPPRTCVWQCGLTELAHNYDALMHAIPFTTPLPHPTLFIRGERSSYITDDDLPLIRRLFPASQVVTIPQAGHWVHSDAPTAVVRVITEFLEEKLDK